MTGRRALVTGSSGFVGRHMVAELVRRGWTVAGVDLRPWPAATALDGDSGGRYEYATGDMLDALRLPGIGTFDLVVHCAYHVGGRAGIDGHPEYLARNLQLDAALFEWALRTGQRRVLYFSSSAAYPIDLQTGSPQQALAEAAIDLDRVRQPDAAYGWAKLTGERLALAARDAGLQVNVVRPFSGYGADQDDVYPFPAIARRAAAGDLTVWGPPGQCRDWIHIDDVVRIALAVADANDRGPVNLCTGFPVEFGDLAQLVWRLAHPQATRADIPRVRYLADRPTGVRYRVGATGRMLQHRAPRVSLAEGIARALVHLGGGRS